MIRALAALSKKDLFQKPQGFLFQYSIFQVGYFLFSEVSTFSFRLSTYTGQGGFHPVHTPLRWKISDNPQARRVMSSIRRSEPFNLEYNNTTVYPHCVINKLHSLSCSCIVADRHIGTLMYHDKKASPIGYVETITWGQPFWIREYVSTTIICIPCYGPPKADASRGWEGAREEGPIEIDHSI